MFARRLRGPRVRALVLRPCSPMLAPPRADAVRGSVQTPDGKPVPGAAVTLDGPMHAPPTDAAGAFTFAQLAPGSYDREPAKSGFERSNATTSSWRPPPGHAQRDAHPASFSSLQTIGRVSTSSGKIPINTSTAALDIIPGTEFADQGSVQVTSARGRAGRFVDVGGGRRRCESLVARRADVPADPRRAAIRNGVADRRSSGVGRRDRHVLSAAGVPALLQSTEIAKGPGAMPIEINYAIGGTVNYRTLEPTRDANSRSTPVSTGTAAWNRAARHRIDGEQRARLRVLAT